MFHNYKTKTGLRLIDREPKIKIFKKSLIAKVAISLAPIPTPLESSQLKTA